MKAVWSVIVVASLMGGEKVAWERPDNALPVAAATGKPVCWYFLTGEQVRGVETPGC
jgi:hypothetical protein